MAEATEKLIKLKALTELGENVKAQLKTVSDKVDGIEAAHGEANVIEKIKVNGVEQSVSEKAVDIKVPKAVSELTNDSKFQTDTQVSATVQTAIAGAKHASFKVVEALPEYAAAEDNVLYLFKNTRTQKYDIYAKVEGSEVLEQLDDVSVDLTDYVKTEKLTEELAKKADASALEGKANAEHNHNISEITDLEIASDEEVTAAINAIFADAV